MRIKRIINIGILSFLILLGSCSKFPEGPKLSLRTVKSRVSGNWEITSYTVGGVDSLATLSYNQITIDKFKTKKLSTGNGFTSARFNFSDILTYPNGEKIASVMVRDKNNLEFNDPIVGREPLLYSDTSFAGRYFLYKRISWVGAYAGSKRNEFHIVKSKENNMKLKSFLDAENVIEYEFKKIK